MRKQIIKSVVFLVGLYLILSIGERIVMEGIRAEHTVWNQLMQGQINADILFCGSSRTLVHFDPETIEPILKEYSCYNIGINGARLNVGIPALKAYLNHNKKPKVIIQQIDWRSVYVEPGSKHIYEPYQFIPYLYEKELYNALVSIDGIFWRYKYIPLYSFAMYKKEFTEAAKRGYLEKYGSQEISNERIKGFSPKYLEWDFRFESYKKENPHGIRVKINDVGCAQIEEFIQFCQSNNILLILVYAPEYYEATDLMINRDELFSTIQTIADTSGTPFWNYAYTPQTRSRDNFYNSQHLNARAAREFSREFAHRLRQYLNEQ